MPLHRDDFFDEEFYSQFPELAEDTRGIANMLFPGQQLTPQQEAEMANLEARRLQLQPMAAPQLQGSTRIAGNPHSYDRSPIFNAVQQGLNQLINAKRQKELLGDPEEALKWRRKKGEGRSSVVNEMAEQKAREAEGILPQLQRLETQQSRNVEARQNRGDFLSNVYPDIASRMVDIEGRLMEEAADQMGQQELQKLRAEDYMDRITKRFENDMELLKEEAKLSGGSGGRRTLPAAVLNTLSENVGAMQDRIEGDINALRTDEIRIERAMDDPEQLERIKSRLGDKTPQERLDEIKERRSKLQSQLDRSIDQMIRVSAERNNLPESAIRGLMGIEDASPEADSTTTPPPSSNTSVSLSDLENYAEEYFEGDMDRARRWARDVRGYNIEE